ncbi:MAG: invasion associated locus B family protein [Pseudobdellovibrionaceae bacterium]|jgi:invasion protein IalB|nr:invasion associated locus B family protein [Pseudobdellovibrionaceae bacterium]
MRVRYIVSGVVFLVILGVSYFFLSSDGSGDNGRRALDHRDVTTSLKAGDISADHDGEWAVVPDAWVKRCEKESQRCEIFQNISLKENGKRLVEMAVGFSDKSSDKARAVILSPLGVLLDKGVEIQVSDLKPISVPFRTCTDAGCAAIFEISDEMLDSMINGRKMLVIFHSTSGQAYKIEMSLGGFGSKVAELL